MSDAPGSGFGKFVPGFEFLQNLAGQAAGGVAQGISQNIPQLPNLGSWVAPTFNVEDLEKRIEELKAVHFWLDQNAKALGATIQALEVQRMTLSTLQSMNLPLADLSESLKIRPQAPAPAPSPAPAPVAPPAAPVAEAPPAPRKAAAKAPAPAAVDPLQWWGALTQQFTELAAQAVKDSTGDAVAPRAQPAAGKAGGAARKAPATKSRKPRKRGAAAAG
jgi:hypothetical protein